MKLKIGELYNEIAYDGYDNYQTLLIPIAKDVDKGYLVAYFFYLHKKLEWTKTEVKEEVSDADFGELEDLFNNFDQKDRRIMIVKLFGKIKRD